MSTLDVASRLAAEVLGDVDRGHAYTSEVLSDATLETHRWSAVEQLWREVRYYILKGSTAEKRTSALKALRFHQDLDVLLEPLSLHGKAASVDIKELVVQAGVRLDELPEHNLRLPPLPKPGKIMLSQTDIRGIVRDVLRG